MTSTSPSSAVCCMCGDHGLPQELFRCRVCHDRSQHKYCSDLYPKEEQYRVCNWCLREGGGGGGGRPSGGSGNSNSNISSSSTSDTGGESGLGGVKLHRGPFSSHLNKPIKKQRVPKRSVSDVTQRTMRSSEEEAALGRRRTTRRGQQQDFRGKARRYKLLEDVSA